jgi:tRNA G37 N-methylase Trm5
LTIGLSARRKLPVVKLYDWTFAPWEIQKIMWTRGRFRKFDLTKNGPYYEMTVYGNRMRLLRYHAVAVINELEQWERCYLPQFIEGKSVLDVGSGCGETALLFLKAGASEVIGVEQNKEAYALSIENAARNNLNFKPINEQFKLDHLKIPHDLLKMDIEGGESLLLNASDIELGHAVLETHSLELTEMLSKKFCLRIADRLHSDTWILRNF